MKILTIVYFVVATILSILTALFLQMHIEDQFSLLLIPFFVFLFIYGVLVLFFIYRREKSVLDLQQQIAENGSRTNEWKQLVKKAHYNEVDELTNEIHSLKQSHKQELDALCLTHKQGMLSLEMMNNQKIQELEMRHEKEKEQLIEEKRDAVLSLIMEKDELLPYKLLVDGCASSFGANRDGMYERLHEAESILSSSVPSMEGKIYERYVAYILKTEGWKDIEFTPASGDYGGDILGIDPQGIRACVQCKRYKEGNPIGQAAMHEVIGAKAYYHRDKAYLCSNHDVTKQAYDFAQETGVVIRIIK